MLNDKIYRHHNHDSACGCGHDHDHDHEHEWMDENVDFGDSVIQIEDEESGETYDFAIADDFEYEDQLYYVLVPVSDDPEEEMVYVIARAVEEDGEHYIETLSDEENETVYAVYDQILEESLAEDDAD